MEYIKPTIDNAEKFKSKENIDIIQSNDFNVENYKIKQEIRFSKYFWIINVSKVSDNNPDYLSNDSKEKM